MHTMVRKRAWLREKRIGSVIHTGVPNGHSVLPAFVLGLVMSRHYEEHREEQKRLRVVAFAFLTPFFFIKGGMNVSLVAVGANLGPLLVLLAAKIVPKMAFVYPLARRADRRHAAFTTLLPDAEHERRIDRRLAYGQSEEYV
jgi:Kef-type K+ transport system membrane component KefB